MGVLLPRSRRGNEPTRRWTCRRGDDASSASLPDEGGARPLVVQTRDGLAAFAPSEQPVPVERAVFTGHVLNLTPQYPLKDVDLWVGKTKVPIDAHGDYRVAVEGRGTVGIHANTGAGFTRRHGVSSPCEEGCPPVLVPLAGSARYRVDLDVKIVPEDCP